MRLRVKRPAALELSIDAQVGARYFNFLREHLLAAHRLLSAPLRELSLAIVSAPKMARLHESFLGVPGPTDVLTFELDHNSKGEIITGEVVICMSVARKMAKASHRPVRDELLLYALHGMLHLCGFDDKTRRGYTAMHAKEDEILVQLGVGPVFLAAAKSNAIPGAG